jgi:acetyltransferase
MGRRRLRHARRWQIDQACPADRDGLHALLTTCSQSTIRWRFFAPLRGFPERYLDTALAGRPEVHDAVVARDVERGQLAGLASLAAGSAEGPEIPELGVLVADRWQQQGLGAAMVECLLTRARERGVQRILAVTLPQRAGMLRVLARHLPMETSTCTPDGVSAVFRLT